jgi:hypothetical protein
MTHYTESRVESRESRASLLIALVWFLLLAAPASAQFVPGHAPVFGDTGNGSGGSGSGGIVSNQVIVATVANTYTNSTDQWIEGIGNIGTTTAGRLLVNVTNSNNTRFDVFSENVGTAGASTNQINFRVPPGGWWRFGSVTTTLQDGSQVLEYQATNGSTVFATSAGSASSATTASYVTSSPLTNDVAAATGAFGQVVVTGGLIGNGSGLTNLPLAVSTVTSTWYGKTNVLYVVGSGESTANAGYRLIDAVNLIYTNDTTHYYFAPSVYHYAIFDAADTELYANYVGLRPCRSHVTGQTLIPTAFSHRSHLCRMVGSPRSAGICF